MVEGADDLLESATQKIADGRHNGLKAAEPGARDEHIPAADLADGEPLADGNGKRVHTQGEGCEKNRKNPHGSSFLSDSEMTLIL